MENVAKKEETAGDVYQDIKSRHISVIILILSNNPRLPISFLLFNVRLAVCGILSL